MIRQAHFDEEGSLGTKIPWTPEKLARFKEAFHKADAAKKEERGSFEFEGGLFVIEYARYLIEFLDDKFGTKDK